jgi:hypothetical protein
MCDRGCRGSSPAFGSNGGTCGGARTRRCGGVQPGAGLRTSESVQPSAVSRPSSGRAGDVEAEAAELKARGVVFEKYDTSGIKMKNSIATGGGAKTAWFKDSEGNIMAVSQRVR